MFFQRIKRGAIRTHILARNRFDVCRMALQQSAPRMARTAGMSILAMHVAALPVVPLRTGRALAAGEDAEPPSTLVSLSDTPLVTIANASVAAGPIAVPDSSVRLSGVETGESRVDQQEREAREAAERQRQEEEREAQEAAARQQALVQQAEQKAAALARQQSAEAGDAVAYLMQRATELFGPDGAQDVLYIVERESGGNPGSVNASSGACGMFQANPCSKMGGMGYHIQVEWGLQYIQARYGTPANALAYWNAHYSY